MIARTHQALDTTRQLLARRTDIFHHNQARRERGAEHPASPARAVPQEAGVSILLLTDKAGDIARFRYALTESALLGPMKVLTDRSEVEACVRKAATAVPLFVPRLIITECQLPGMELEEIVAAVRTVPAYEGIPLLLFSAVAEAEGRRRSLQCGATAFVRKPRNWESLLHTVALMVQDWGRMKDRQLPAPERADKGEADEP